MKEVAFVQAYGRELTEAHEWCQKYRVSRKEAELHQVRERGRRSCWREGREKRGKREERERVG